MAAAGDDVFVAVFQEGEDDGRTSGADSVHHDHRIFILAHNLQGVDQAGQGDNGRAVLVVVEDEHVGLFLQAPLNLEAAGGGDVF